jgi:DNA-binding MarR family transcriptional regulator
MKSTLQSELKQTRPFASREEEVFLSLVRTAEMLSWGVEEAIRQADLTPTQYNVLRILRGAGGEGLTCGEIGERMVTRDSDITRLLDRLEARGLISRQRDTTDRRVIIASITGTGLKLLAGLDRPVAECHNRQLGHLGERQLATLARLLEIVRSRPD